MKGKENNRAAVEERKTKRKKWPEKIKKIKEAKRMKTIKPAKVIKAGSAAFILSLLAVSGIHNGYAYFSGKSEVKLNLISLAGGEQNQEGALIIVEPEWDDRKEADAGYAMDMQPGESAVKDPRVESTLNYPCWVFTEVSIPEEWATLEKADNPYEYVTFAGDGVDYTNAFEIVVPEINKEDWQIYGREHGKNLITYVYGYKMPLEAHGTTNPVFESFTVPAFKELEGGENYIIIRAEAVQTEGCLTLDDAARKLGITSDILWTTVQP